MKFLFLFFLGPNILARARDDGEKDLPKSYISQSSAENAPTVPQRVNQVKMNKRIREKIQLGHFNEETYKQCIADELLRSGN